MLSTLVEQGGLLVVAILVASVAAWTLGIHTALRVRAEGAALERLLGELPALCGPLAPEGAAFAHCLRQDRVAGRVLALPLGGHRPGQPLAIRDAAPFVQVEVARFRAPLRLVAALAAACPLLGLLGTVTGMIETFRVLARSGPADAGLLAGGVETALVTTQLGLVAALPVLLLSGYLRSRLGRLEERLQGGLKRLRRLVEPRAAGGGAP